MKAIKSGDMNATLPQLQTSRQIFHGLSVPSSPTSVMPEDTTVQQRRTSRDWDEIMRDLIHGLEQICGPKKGQDRRSLQLDFTLSPAVSGPPSPRIFNQELLRTERGIHDNGGGGHGSVNYRRHSDEPSLRNRGQRTLFVRHIETHENLNSKLFEICRQGSLTEVVRSRTSGERWGAVRLAMTSALASKTYQGLEEEEKNSQRLVRMSERRVRFDMGDEEDDADLLQVSKDQRDIRLYAKDDQRDARLQFEGDQQHLEEGDQRNTEFRAEEDQADTCLPMEDQLESHPIQVEVGSRAIEDLVVSVSDQRHLTVEAISTFGDSILHDSLLSDDLTSGSLLCHLTGNGQLYIRRQSPLLATENFVGTGSTFIPIIRRNEASLELTVVLHIPEDFRFDDVVVRTVDSQLVVIGRKRSSSLQQPIDGDRRLDSHDSVRPSFRVFVQLPREVNCRSVNASLTEDHQLIVKGDIDPTPRRNSL